MGTSPPHKKKSIPHNDMKNLGLFNFSAFVCAVITASTEAVNATVKDVAPSGMSIFDKRHWRISQQKEPNIMY